MTEETKFKVALAVLSCAAVALWAVVTFAIVAIIKYVWLS